MEFNRVLVLGERHSSEQRADHRLRRQVVEGEARQVRWAVLLPLRLAVLRQACTEQAADLIQRWEDAGGAGGEGPS